MEIMATLTTKIATIKNDLLENMALVLIVVKNKSRGQD
jgi:hypothetical protein